METDEKIMTTEESLKIISDMINKTKVNVRQGSFHLLFWGWLIFFCSFTEYILLNFSNISNPWYLWFLTIPGAFIFWIFALIANFAGPSISPLVTFVAMLAGYLLPGYLLKRKVNHDTV